MDAAVQTTTPAVAEKVPLLHGSVPKPPAGAYDPGAAGVQPVDEGDGATVPGAQGVGELLDATGT
jgi:hypothetical protein